MNVAEVAQELQSEFRYGIRQRTANPAEAGQGPRRPSCLRSLVVIVVMVLQTVGISQLASLEASCQQETSLNCRCRSWKHDKILDVCGDEKLRILQSQCLDF